MARPTLNEIEIQWRTAGAGVCVIVEGETELDDAWFYGRWFGQRAREVSFFPQNGWEKVVEAVAYLRTRLGEKRVYGIVDRDFEASIPLDDCPSDGLLRIPKYTLENYLLDPACWFKYVQPYTLRVPKLGWGTTEEAATTIQTLYRQCMGLSAYNWAVRQLRVHQRAQFDALPEIDRQYKEHPRALERPIQPVLEPLYIQRLKDLQNMPFAALEQVVSGKYVLALLRASFPLGRLSDRQWDDVLSAYMSICPQPPSDLTQIVNLILRDAHLQNG